MKFTKLSLSDSNSQRVYDNYIRSVESAVKPLLKEDKLDVLMEFNSHIYESLQSKSGGSEMDNLLNAIDRLGSPEAVLKPLVADKLLEKATRTFNPIHVCKALLYNIANGISFVIFATFYLFLFTLIFLAGAKLFNRDVGMYVQDDNYSSFAIGLVDNTEGYTEVLGNWFIPVMLLATIVLYFLITYLLKYKRSLTKKHKMKSIVTCLALLLMANSSYSQKSDFSKLDSFFNVLEQNDKFLGSITVSQGGVLTYVNSLGFANKENEGVNDSETKFRIGSITKTFTSVMLMKAVEMNKVKLDDPIVDFFPDIKKAKKITIKHLLNHKSGIHNFTDDDDYWGWYTHSISRQSLLNKIVSKGVDFRPGSKMSYSNSNYVLLTWILEDVFDMSYSDLLDQLIVHPLGLSNTKYGSKIDTGNNEASSYEKKSGWKKSLETDTSVPLGAGGIISTPSDLCLFIEGLYEEKLISKESLNLMKPEEKEWYGLGLFNLPFYDKVGSGHTGGIDAFTSSLSYFEEDEVCFALTSNGTDYNNNDIAIAVLSHVFDQPYDIPVFRVTDDIDSASLDQYLGIYTSDQLPIDLKIYKEDKVLYAQGTGQPAFILSAEGDHEFACHKIDLKLKFNPDEKNLILEQGGGKFVMEVQN